MRLPSGEEATTSTRGVSLAVRVFSAFLLQQDEYDDETDEKEQDADRRICQSGEGKPRAANETHETSGKEGGEQDQKNEEQ